MIDQNMTSKSCFLSCLDGGGLDGARERFSNRVRKRPMDASHAISIAVKQARAVTESAQSATIVHLCPRCVVPRIVISRKWALLSDSRPSPENRRRIPLWPRHACSCARYSRKSRTRSRPDPNCPKGACFDQLSLSCAELPFSADW